LRAPLLSECLPSGNNNFVGRFIARKRGEDGKLSMNETIGQVLVFSAGFMTGVVLTIASFLCWIRDEFGKD
jgi:hypothetical protein